MDELIIDKDQERILIRQALGLSVPLHLQQLANELIE